MIVKGQRMCMSEYGELKRDIMEEAHSSAYAMHLGSTKMYKTLKEHYWWNGMKKKIASFISICLTCQQVKAKHQRPMGKIQLLPIPVWKWEKITMERACRQRKKNIYIYIYIYIFSSLLSKIYGNRSIGFCQSKRQSWSTH